MSTKTPKKSKTIQTCLSFDDLGIPHILARASPPPPPPPPPAQSTSTIRRDDKVQHHATDAIILEKRFSKLDSTRRKTGSLAHDDHEHGVALPPLLSASVKGRWEKSPWSTAALNASPKKKQKTLRPFMAEDGSEEGTLKTETGPRDEDHGDQGEEEEEEEETIDTLLLEMGIPFDMAEVERRKAGIEERKRSKKRLRRSNPPPGKSHSSSHLPKPKTQQPPTRNGTLSGLFSSTTKPNLAPTASTHKKSSGPSSTLLQPGQGSPSPKSIDSSGSKKKERKKGSEVISETLTTNGMSQPLGARRESMGSGGRSLGEDEEILFEQGCTQMEFNAPPTQAQNGDHSFSSELDLDDEQPITSTPILHRNASASSKSKPSSRSLLLPSDTPLMQEPAANKKSSTIPAGALIPTSSASVLSESTSTVANGNKKPKSSSDSTPSLHTPELATTITTSTTTVVRSTSHSQPRQPSAAGPPTPESVKPSAGGGASFFASPTKFLTRTLSFSSTTGGGGNSSNGLALNGTNSHAPGPPQSPAAALTRKPSFTFSASPSTPDFNTSGQGGGGGGGLGGLGSGVVAAGKALSSLLMGGGSSAQLDGDGSDGGKTLARDRSESVTSLRTDSIREISQFLREDVEA
ncbi:hypothetical protein T439DRAFT_160841 [Meredithblackwellia eburnea MCA 4105]